MLIAILVVNVLILFTLRTIAKNQTVIHQQIVSDDRALLQALRRNKPAV